MPSIQRDSYLDNWRGLFHVTMLADHLAVLFPGVFTLISWCYEAVGFVSVAEGFVFLSGYVTGLVYTRVQQEKDTRALWHKSILRAFTIYATYLAAVILLLSLVKLGGVSDVAWGPWNHLFGEPQPLASAQVAGLFWQPTFLEVLPMYSLFLLFAPLMITQLNRKRHWLVISVSLLLWVGSQFGMRRYVYRLLGVDGEASGFFDSFAWQILFVGGLICGHKTYRTGKKWLPRDWMLPLAAYTIALFFIAWRYHVLEIPISDRWIQRSTLGPLRLLNVACIVFLIARFRSSIEKVIDWKGFAFLSRHSLQVFAFHLVPIYAAALLIPQKLRLLWWGQLLFIVFCVLGLYCTASLTSVAKGWRRKPAPSLPIPTPMEDVPLR